MGAKAYSTRYSQEVSHPSTNQARPCLASEIRRDRALPGWDGRRHALLRLQPSSHLHTPPPPNTQCQRRPKAPTAKGKPTQPTPPRPSPIHSSLHLTTAPHTRPTHGTVALPHLQPCNSTAMELHAHSTPQHGRTDTHGNTHSSPPSQTYSYTDHPTPRHQQGCPSRCSWYIPLYWPTAGSPGLCHPAVTGLQQPGSTRSPSQIRPGLCVGDGRRRDRVGNIPQPTRTVSLIKQTLFAMAAAGLAENSLTWLLPHDSTLVSFSPGSPLAEYFRFTIFLTLS